MSLNRTVEQHIIILLGAASRDPKRYTNIDEKTLYILFFLMTDEHKKLRTKVYHFKKGIYLPESDILRKCLRDPKYFKECWTIDETGIKLTDKGVDKFKSLMRSNRDVLESFTSLLYEMSINNISVYELEYIVQLRYPNFVTKYVDMIDKALKTNPNLDREQLLKQLKDTDFIHNTVKKAIFVNSVETRKYGKGTIAQSPPSSQ